MRNVKKGRQVWEVAMEQGPIDPVPIDTGIVHGNIRTGTRFP